LYQASEKFPGLRYLSFLNSRLAVASRKFVEQCGAAMRKQSLIDRIGGGLLVLSLGFLVSGTDACQENYDFAAQTSFTPVPSSTATPSVTPTGTITSTITPAPAESGTPSPVTPTVGASPTSEEALGDPSLFTELSALSVDRDDVAGAVLGSGSSQGGNWLGKAYSNQGSDSWLDSDGDGYSDTLEDEEGTDSRDSGSAPLDVITTRFGARLQGSDEDLDGLSVKEERQRNTDPSMADSDGDGRGDGAEVASGGDPLASKDTYTDSDGDGLSDEVEKTIKTDPNKSDSDGDGLRDDRELVFGANPLVSDSDLDGISDGKEAELGSDPISPENKN